MFVNREIQDGHDDGSYQHALRDFDRSEAVEIDDDSSEYTSSLDYDPAAYQLHVGTPPNPRAVRRMKARSSSQSKIAVQEHDIIAHLDQQQQHKKRSAKNTKSRRYDRTQKMQFADDVPSSSVSASSNIVKVDTSSRIVCLNPKMIIKKDDSLSSNDSQPVSLPGVSLAAAKFDCPDDRYDFYQIFSTLIRLGNAPKKEKEHKGGLFGNSPYNRQLSTEQELWQTHLCDLIWFELQAYINVRTNKDQDDYLCEARRGIDGTLDRVMSFSASTVTSTIEHVPTNGLSDECFCGKWHSGYSGVCLQQVIRTHCAVSKMVTSVLDDIENAESLYPTQKALAAEHPMYAADKFQQRIATLCLWMTITRDIAHKIKLMSEIALISDQSLAGTTWCCVDLRSLQTLLLGYSSKDICTATDDDCSLVDDTADEVVEDTETVNSATSSGYSSALSVPPRGFMRQKSVHFEDEQGHMSDPQSRSESRLSRASRTNSTEVTPTSIYRLYVDALLKKTGLRKLRARLKELLDTTLQRARLALLPADYNSQPGISNISKVLHVFVSFLETFSSSSCFSLHLLTCCVRFLFAWSCCLEQHAHMCTNIYFTALWTLSRITWVSRYQNQSGFY